MQKKKLLLIILSLTFLFSNLISITKIDSLEAILSEVNDEDRIPILNKLSSLFRNLNPDVSYDYAVQAYELSKKKNNKIGIVGSLNNIGHYFRKINDFDQAIANFQQALEICRKLKDDCDIANIYDNIGHIHWLSGDFSNALDYYKRSLGMFVALGDLRRQSMAYNNIGSVYFRLGIYDESMNNFLNSLSIREEMDDPKICSTLNNLGNIYVRLCDYEKALEMYQRSLKYKRKLNKNPQSTLNNIGNVYLKLNDYSKALQYLTEALIINEENEDEKRIASSLNNIAIVYEEKGRLDQAVDYYQKALDLKKKVGDTYGYANTSKNLGWISLTKKDYKQADFYFRQSLEIAKKIKARDLVKDNYDLLSQCYSAINDFENAYLYKKYCSNVRDSLFNEETSDKIAQYRTNFTIEKTLREKEMLIKDNEIIKLQMEKIKSWWITLFLLVMFFIIFAILLYFNINKKKKINKLLAETNENLRKEIEIRKITSNNLQSSLKEKDVMLKEIHHRVNNNLQVISSILDLQSRSSTNKEFITMLRNTQNRIISMSLVQEKLYSSGDLALVDFNNYINSLIDYIYGTYEINPSRIKPVINVEDIHVNINTAIPCGLLINEIVTNAIKHGFNDNKKGEIFINMKKDKSEYLHLVISNNGVHLPDGINYENPISIGMELIRIMIIQLSADVELQKEKGVIYKFRFKELKN